MSVQVRRRRETAFLMAAGASSVGLADPRTVEGLAYLVSIGLLTQARETAILASPAPTT